MAVTNESRTRYLLSGQRGHVEIYVYKVLHVVLLLVSKPTFLVASKIRGAGIARHAQVTTAAEISKTGHKTSRLPHVTNHEVQPKLKP